MKEPSTQYELSNFLQENIRREHLSLPDKAVLMAIVHHMNPATDWECFPSYDRIADIACVSRRTAVKCVGELLDKNYLTYTKGGQHKSNRYKPNFKVLLNLGKGYSKRNFADDLDDDLGEPPF